MPGASSRLVLQVLEDARRSHAAADAHGDHAVLRVAPLHLEEKEIDGYENRMMEVEKSIYDAIEFDSGPEETFARDLDSREDIKLFVKLPPWFTVETPIGTYNPD